MNEYYKIKKARELLGLSQSEFASKVGATQKDVSNIEAGKKKFIPKGYIEFLISQNFDINSLFDDDSELRYIQDILHEPTQVYQQKTDTLINKQSIPLYSKEVAAGITPLFSDLNSENQIDYLHIPNMPKCDGAIFATGDSMYPLVKSGDIIAFKVISDIPADIFWGQMYIIDVTIAGENYTTLKYIKKGRSLEYILLVSANKHHEDKEVKLTKVRGLAQVKGIVRFP